MTLRATSVLAAALMGISVLAACGSSPKAPSPLQSAELASRCEKPIQQAGELTAKTVHFATYNMVQSDGPPGSAAGVETFTISTTINGTDWKCVVVGDPQDPSTWRAPTVTKK